MKNNVKEHTISTIINIFYMLVTICFFAFFCKKAYEDKHLFGIDMRYVVFVFFTVIFVNLIKALRLYIVLFGHKFDLDNFIWNYIKTAFVNMMVPYKFGELYRGYCIGTMIKSIVDGYIMVVFDRFIDTLALISIIFCFSFFMDIELSRIYIFLTFFLVVVILLYNLFKPLYQYWNHFLIYNKSSKHTLIGLQFLKMCNEAFSNVSFIVKGRFVMLYILSLIAWTAEIGMIVVVGKAIGGVEVSTYLVDIMTGNLNFSNMMYTMLCFVFFLMVGIALFLYKLIKEK